MKILFTSVGRRVELIQCFKEAATNLKINLSVHGSDINKTAPALYFCDEYVISPRINDENYISFLIEYCRKNSINALIPTIDTDLIKLSENRKLFEDIGTLVFISDLDKVKICRDKILTYNFFNDLGLSSPKPYNDYQNYIEGFPAFIKPIDGSSSISTYKVNSIDQLKLFANIVPNYIIQKFINGIEYSVDALCDYEGNPIFITPRIRLAVRSGEVLKTQFVHDNKIIEETKKILSIFKPRGQISIQLIREKDTNIDYFIEINPRFGGGSPLSIKAGANSSEQLLRLLNNEKVKYIENAAEEGAIYSRFDQSIRVDK